MDATMTPTLPVFTAADFTNDTATVFDFANTSATTSSADYPPGDNNTNTFPVLPGTDTCDEEMSGASDSETMDSDSDSDSDSGPVSGAVTGLTGKARAMHLASIKNKTRVEFHKGRGTRGNTLCNWLRNGLCSAAGKSKAKDPPSALTDAMTQQLAHSVANGYDGPRTTCQFEAFLTCLAGKPPEEMTSARTAMFVRSFKCLSGLVLGQGTHSAESIKLIRNLASVGEAIVSNRPGYAPQTRDEKDAAKVAKEAKAREKREKRNARERQKRAKKTMTGEELARVVAMLPHTIE